MQVYGTDEYELKDEFTVSFIVYFLGSEPEYSILMNLTKGNGP